MSRSGPFFNSTAPRRYPKVEIIDDKAYAQLHWTKQLELRPLGTRTRREWPEGDFNTQIDMWDSNEYEQEIKETT